MTTETMQAPIARTKTQPRVYIASLADYNAGRLLGDWMDADQGAADLHEQIQALLAESEYFVQTWAIHDYEGFGAWEPREDEDIEIVAAVARGISEHGELFGTLVSQLGTVEEASRYIHEAYCGAWNSVGEYASSFVNDGFSGELAELPDFVRSHIDYEAVGDDLERQGDIFAVSCGGFVHVFIATI